MVARPSGAATTVSAPLTRTTAPMRRAAARARVSLSSSGLMFGGALEQLDELALVGVMTASCPPRLISAASRGASPAKLVSASASSTIVRGLAGRVTPPRRACAGRTDARARPKHDGAARSSAMQRLEFAGVGEGATITAVRWAELTATASGGLATLTMPAPARKAARAESRAAPVWWLEPDGPGPRRARSCGSRRLGAAAPRPRPPAH